MKKEEFTLFVDNLPESIDPFFFFSLGRFFQEVEEVVDIHILERYWKKSKNRFRFVRYRL